MVNSSESNKEPESPNLDVIESDFSDIDNVNTTKRMVFN